MRRLMGLVMLGTLAGCQTGPVAPDVIRAACVTQKYLRVNGYLDTAPGGPTDVTLTRADVETYENADGALDYARLVKDRSRRFSGKLRGVMVAPDSGKYTVVYGPVGKDRRRCLGVVSNFAFAFFAEGACKDSASLVRLRERNLACGAAR